MSVDNLDRTIFGWPGLPKGQSSCIEGYDNRLPMKQLTLLVRDLQAPQPMIFWIDLVCCLLAIQIGLYLSAPFPEVFIDHPIVAFAGFTVAVLALYRASYFNHELAHHGRRL